MSPLNIPLRSRNEAAFPKATARRRRPPSLQLLSLVMLSFAYVAAGTPPAAQPYSAAMRGAFDNEYAWPGVDDWSTAAPLPDAANVDWWGDLDPDAGAWLILLRKPAHDDDLQRDLDSPSVEPGLPSLLKKYCAGADAAWSSLTTTFTELLALGPVEYAYSTGVYPSFEAAANPQARVPKFLTRLSTPRNVLFPTHTVAMFWTTVRKMEGTLGAFVTEGRLVDADLPVEIRKRLDEMKASTAPAPHCTSARALRVLRMRSAFALHVHYT